jgi:hypothetical protein
MAVSNPWVVTGHVVPFSQPKSSPPKVNLRPSCFVPGWSCNSNSSLVGLASNKIRKSSNYSCCRCSSNSSSSLNITSGSSCSDWDWSRWSRHFSETEQAESFVSVLKFQLEEAVERENFQEAAKLKMAIAEAASKDTVAEIMSQLKSAIEEERYLDASKLCKSTGSGLVGWWVGYSEDSDDPFGRLVRITPSTGRFIGRCYNARQLVTSSPGTPLFEIFVVKDAGETYTMQVVYLHRQKGKSVVSPSSTSKSKKSQSSSKVESASVVDLQEADVKTETNDEKGLNIEGATEEGIKSVINFLKEKIPGLKVKIMNVNVTEEMMEENDAVKQLIQEDEEETSSEENLENEENDVEEIHSDDEVSIAKGDSKDLDMKLFLGGVVHNEDEPSKDDFVRIPADIKELEKDSFLLHIPGRSLDQDSGNSKVTKVKVAAIAAQSVSELMPPDLAKAFLVNDKISPKAARNVREFVKQAVSQAEKRSKLYEFTNFNRINTSKGDLDPFDGLYVGAFGPYGTEVVQLRRKYGHWNSADEDSSDVEFFEYVEAVKLTGDLNVPAGQVTFRAKIGKGARNSGRGMFPDELGVLASYKGQGRIAEFGFKNPKWVEGELLQLNGKGMGPYLKGADLGFLYVVPDQSFLVLFNRLKLPE